MKRSHVFTVLICILIVIAGCKKKVAEENPDYIGMWRSEAMYLDESIDEYIVIYESSSADYVKITGSSEVKASGTAKINDKVLKIGVKSFDIDEEPVRLGNVDQIWRMKLDGTTFYCDKDMPRGYFYLCSPLELCVENTGNDTLTGTLGGNQFVLLPGNEICSEEACFGCPVVYNDDNGNSYTFYATNCTGTVEVQ